MAIGLDEELTAGLRTLARRHGGTLFVAALTGWSLVLSRLAGETDIVVGVPTANRRSRDLAGLIGFFVNSLAVRVDLSGAPTVSTALDRTRAAVRGALDHQDLPFERVVELVNPPRSIAHSPLFQTMFAWQPSRSGLLGLPDVEAEPSTSRSPPPSSTSRCRWPRRTAVWSAISTTPPPCSTMPAPNVTRATCGGCWPRWRTSPTGRSRISR